MPLSITNKVGIVLTVCGAVIVGSFHWVPLIVLIAGGVLLVPGLYLALRNREPADVEDSSSRWTNDGDEV